MDELNGVSARFHSHPDAAEVGCQDCYAGGLLVPLGKEKIPITGKNGMQALRTSTQTNNVYFFSGTKKAVKGDNIMPGVFLFFVFFPREKAGSQSGPPEKEHYYPPPILENAFLITDKQAKRKFLLSYP